MQTLLRSHTQDGEIVSSQQAAYHVLQCLPALLVLVHRAIHVLPAQKMCSSGLSPPPPPPPPQAWSVASCICSTMADAASCTRGEGHRPLKGWHVRPLGQPITPCLWSSHSVYPRRKAWHRFNVGPNGSRPAVPQQRRESIMQGREEWHATVP